MWTCGQVGLLGVSEDVHYSKRCRRCKLSSVDCWQWVLVRPLSRSRASQRSRGNRVERQLGIPMVVVVVIVAGNEKRQCVYLFRDRTKQTVVFHRWSAPNKRVILWTQVAHTCRLCVRLWMWTSVTRSAMKANDRHRLDKEYLITWDVFVVVRRCN